VRRPIPPVVALLALLASATAIACSLSTDADHLTGGADAESAETGEAALTDGGGGLDEGSLSDRSNSQSTEGASGDVALSTAYRDAVQADHPVDYWRLGDSLGSKTAYDLASPHPGQVTGSVALGAPGALLNDSDGAFDFSSSGYVTVTGAFSFTGSAFSTELWVRPKFNDAVNRFALAKATQYPDISGFEVSVQNGLVCGVVAHQSNFGNACGAIAVNEFSHVVFTYDLSKCRTYVNGALKDEQDCSAIAITLAATDLTLGAFSPALFPLEGALDEVAIYDHVLPLDRVAAHFHASGR
jgi:hypothetical protein